MFSNFGEMLSRSFLRKDVIKFGLLYRRSFSDKSLEREGLTIWPYYKAFILFKFHDQLNSNTLKQWNLYDTKAGAEQAGRGGISLFFVYKIIVKTADEI